MLGFLTLFGCCAIALSQTCGKPVVSPEKQYTPGVRIVGGNLALNNSWPWIGALIKSKPGVNPYQSCGGTLISERYFLTAGHCVDSSSEAEIKKKLKVLLGVSDLLQLVADPEKIFGIERVILHPKYNQPKGSTNNDIAVIKLDRIVPFSAEIQPACLPDKSIADDIEQFTFNPINKRRVCFVAGWGSQADGGKPLDDAGKQPILGAGSDDLYQVNIEMYNQSQCHTKVTSERYYYDNTSMLCGGFDTGGKDSCQGDSGGPLVCRDLDDRWVLFGIVSWGGGCATAVMPGIYVNVVNFIYWILEAVQSIEASLPIAPIVN